LEVIRVSLVENIYVNLLNQNQTSNKHYIAKTMIYQNWIRN